MAGSSRAATAELAPFARHRIDLRDRIVIVHLPSWAHPDQADQLLATIRAWRVDDDMVLRDHHLRPREWEELSRVDIAPLLVAGTPQDQLPYTARQPLSGRSRYPANSLGDVVVRFGSHSATSDSNTTDGASTTAQNVVAAIESLSAALQYRLKHADHVKAILVSAHWFLSLVGPEDKWPSPPACFLYDNTPFQPDEQVIEDCAWAHIANFRKWPGLVSGGKDDYLEWRVPLGMRAGREGFMSTLERQPGWPLANVMWRLRRDFFTSHYPALLKLQRQQDLRDEGLAFRKAACLEQARPQREAQAAALERKKGRADMKASLSNVHADHKLGRRAANTARKAAKETAATADDEGKMLASAAPSHPFALDLEEKAAAFDEAAAKYAVAV